MRVARNATGSSPNGSIQMSRWPPPSSLKARTLPSGVQASGNCAPGRSRRSSRSLLPSADCHARSKPPGAPDCKAIRDRPESKRGADFPDQDFSIADRTSFAVMLRLGVHRAAALDDDFAVFRFGKVKSRAFDRSLIDSTGRARAFQGRRSLTAISRSGNARGETVSAGFQTMRS